MSAPLSPTASSSKTASASTHCLPPRSQSPSPSTSDFSLIGTEEIETSDYADYSFWSYNTSTPYKGFGSFGRRAAIYSTPTLNYFASSIPFPSSSSSSSTPGVDRADHTPGTSLKTLFPRIWDVLVSSPTKNIISTSRSPISSKNFVPFNGIDMPFEAHRHSMYLNYMSNSPTPSLSRLPKGKGKANNYARGSNHYPEQSYSGDISDFWTQDSSFDRSTMGHSISSQYSYIDYTDLPPLDGEEGELIDVDDEACFLPPEQFHYGGTTWRGGIKCSFSRARVVTGIDILSLLPAEVALRVLEFLALGSFCHPNTSVNSPRNSSLWASRDTFLEEVSTPEQCLQNVLVCSSVSKMWRQLSLDNSVWRTLFESRWGNGEFGGGITKDAAAIQKYLLDQRKSAITGRDKALPALPDDLVSSIPIIQPSSLDYLRLYQDRLELERRWVGTAFTKHLAAPAYSPTSSNTSLSVPPSRSSSLTPMYIADQMSPYSDLTSSRSSSFSSTTMGMSNPSPSRPSTEPAVILTEHWDKWEPDVIQLSGHSDSVYCIELPSSTTFAADKFFVTGSRDRTIKMWSSKTAKCIGTFGRGRTPTSPVIHDSGPQEVEVTEGHAGSVLCLKFIWKEENDESNDNDSIRVEEVVRRGIMFSGSSDCTICVWDVCLTWNIVEDEYKVDAHVSTVLRGHSGGVLDLRVDNDWIVSCSKDTTIRVWNRQTLMAHRTLRGHEGPVNAVGMEDGRVVSASGDGKMILWDASSGERLRTFEGHDRGLACIEYSSGLIISGSNDWKIKIWSAFTGKCLRTLQGHEALVRALAFDPSSGLLVSASYDKSVRVWDIKDVLNGNESGRESSLRVFKNAHSSHIFDVKFDVGRIVSTSHDQKIVVANFSCDLDDSHLFI